MDKTITFITSTFPPEINGVTFSMRHLIRHLSKRSIHVKVLMPDYSEVMHLLNPDDLKEIEPYCEIQSYKTNRFQGYTYARVPKAFAIRYQPNNNETVVVLEADRLQMGNLAFPVKPKSAIAFLRQDYYKAAELYFSPRKFKLTHWFLAKYISFIYNRYKKTLVLSEYAKDCLRQIGVKKPISVIRQGLDHNIFQPQGEIEFTLPVVITYVGRIAQEKNLDLLFDSINDDAFNENNIRINIIGDGPLLERYKSQADQRFVKFHGFQNQERIVKIIRQSHFVINPCLCETFGNTVIEAMACGRPVIGVNEGAVANHVNGTNGLLVENNKEELTQLLKNLVKLECDYTPFYRGTIEYANQYTWENACDDFLEQFQ